MTTTSILTYRAWPSTVAPGPTSSPCAVCLGRRLRPKFAVLEVCDDCSHVRARLDVRDADLQALYQGGYFRGQEYTDYVGEAEVHRTNFRYRLACLRRWTKNLAPSFEIGCAYGYWLELLTTQSIPCAGVDICTEGIAHAREYLRQDARLGDFLSLPFVPGQYHSFCLWDTLEHLKYPERFIARIAELLPPGGWLFLSTGDIGSRLARWRGAKWRMIHPPTHLHYFTRRSVTRLCQRQGLVVRHMSSLPIYRNLRTVLGRLAIFDQGWLGHLARRGQHIVPADAQDRLGCWLDLGDIMLVAAQKP